MADDCSDCLRARSRLWHGYADGCLHCAARRLARGPNYHRAMRTGRQHAAYRSDLARYGLGQEAVKQAAAEEGARAKQE